LLSSFDTSHEGNSEAGNLAGKSPRLTGNSRIDWALWSLSLVLRDIAARLTVPVSDTAEVAA
jgi:hypothetical protein